MSLRNVIYYNSSNDQISLAGIAELPYTDVIIANLQPTSASNLTLQGYGPAFDKNLRSNIQALRNAGKNVLISFGGANSKYLTTAAYRSYAGNVNGLVDDIVNNWVMEYGLNGVDIDYEDDAGFDQPGQPASYDGAGFLVALTNGLYQALPSGQNIITHAPSPPFWDPQGGYYAANTQIAAYTQIWQQAGNQIAWINCQFYDNQTYDQTAALKVYWYQQIAEITSPQTMLVGALVGDPALYEPCDQDEGYITLDDMINNVIAPLKAQYGSQFGGIMGWEFAQDGPPTYGTSGAWANGIGQALGMATGCPGQSYTVVAGDTLMAIAQRFLGNGTLWVELTKPDGTTFTEAEAENLQIGQVVCVPVPGGCPGQSYTVVAGDTLSGIAQRFLGDGALWVELTKPDGTTFTEAEAENLQIGQMVCIPGQSTIDFSIWSLQEPSGSGTSPTTISPSQLVAGHSDAYFYKAADGGQAFMDTKTGITTSGSTHCRTELREMTSSGAHAAWAPSGTNTMDVTGQVTLLGGGSSGKVTVGQVYDSNDSIPLCELQYSARVGGFVLVYEEAKGTGTTIDLQTPVALNTPYSFQLSLSNSVLTVSINGQQVYSHTPSESILAKTFYFKCGNYDQTTTAGEVTTTPYTIVENYSINVVHA